jgi:hypothetical protein
MKTTCAVLLFATSLACAAAAAPDPPADGTTGTPPEGIASMTAEEVTAMVRSVSTRVESLRGAKFETAVPVRVVDQDTAMKHILARFAKFLPPSEMKNQETVFQSLGLLPSGYDLQASLMAILHEQVGGFYDPDSKTFFVLSQMPRAGASVIIAHELTHALDDARFGLDAALAKARGDSDRSTAIGSVVEGSGTMIMTEFLVQGMREGSITQDALVAFAESESGKAEKLKAAPPIVSASLIAPYVLGQSFLLKGDVSRIATVEPAALAADDDRAFRDMPVSTEQILHPEKYWDAARQDLPRHVVMPDFSKTIGKGWKLVSSDTLGELGLAILAGSKGVDPADPQAGVPSAWTNAAAAGWGGDRWQL